MATKKVAKAKSAKVSGSVPPYGDPIREAIARGNLAEMKKLAVSARKYVSQVEAALAQLEKAIAKK